MVECVVDGLEGDEPSWERLESRIRRLWHWCGRRRPLGCWKHSGKNRVGWTGYSYSCGVDERILGDALVIMQNAKWAEFSRVAEGAIHRITQATKRFKVVLIY
ncbi:hypothetical protein CPB83DRAFT_69165 [Crepidotus variabilis]|uniref:Uncharacterized protein n=1 Tax=Crepidotus variabilis TaxID=179855 RepID=A0A9P6E5R1_9AGAR|nr:hypothetical protein CPB83DRAFT_69165 [Crepidotus variabilis]